MFKFTIFFSCFFLCTDVERESSNLNAVPTNLYDSSLCVPDLGVYIEYNQTSILPGDDRKPILTTPAPTQTPTPSTPAANNNNFLEGKFSSFCFSISILLPPNNFIYLLRKTLFQQIMDTKKRIYEIINTIAIFCCY